MYGAARSRIWMGPVWKRFGRAALALGLPRVYTGAAMGAHHHPTRRELLESIPVLGAGSLLLPLGVLKGQALDTRTPAIIRGAL